MTKGVEAFEAAKSVNYNGTVSQGPSADLSLEDFQTAAQNQAQLARNTQALAARITPRKRTPAPLPPRKPSSPSKPNTFGIKTNLDILLGTNNPTSSSSPKTQRAKTLQNAVRSMPGSLLGAVGSGTYAGPSGEYSPEDFQTEADIKAYMNTEAYQDTAHPQNKEAFAKVRKGFENLASREEQTKLEQQKTIAAIQKRTDLKNQNIQKENDKITDAANAASVGKTSVGKTSAEKTTATLQEKSILSNTLQTPAPKQTTLGQETVFGGRQSLLDTNQSSSNIDRVMDRMATSQRAKIEREKNLSWKDKSWSTMSAYDRSRTTSAEKSRRRGAGLSKNSATPRSKDAYGVEKTGGTGQLGRGGQLSGVTTGAGKNATTQRANPNQKNRARNKDGSYSLDADGNGAGNAGGTVICTELFHQGLLPLEVYLADQRYGLWLQKNDPYVILGYHLWARPVVKLMQKSKRFTRILNKTLCEPWAREMIIKNGGNGIGTVRGKILFAIGIPVCRMIGKTLEAMNEHQRKAI